MPIKISFDFPQISPLSSEECIDQSILPAMDNPAIGGGLLPSPATELLDIESSIDRHHQSLLHLNPPAELGSDHPMYRRPSISDDDDKKPDSYASSPWHRMKWTDEMVRLLISVVASVGDDGVEPYDGGQKRKPGGGASQKKGKWKTVSKKMLEKGCYVSPQQCEDKFNDLNKRYKRLNDILGKGTTSQVVDNPALLDAANVSPKAKDDARKILSSKHLFYREMCAYHNGQVVPDSTVGNDDHEDGDDEEEEMVDVVLSDPMRTAWERRGWLGRRILQLQEEMVEIQRESLELQRRRFKWMRFCSKKDRELRMMRLENERMALENERMILEVKRKEIELETTKS